LRQETPVSDSGMATVNASQPRPVATRGATEAETLEHALRSNFLLEEPRTRPRRDPRTDPTRSAPDHG